MRKRLSADAVTLAEAHRPVDLTPFIAGQRARRGLTELPAFGILGHQQAVRASGAKPIRLDNAQQGHLATEVFDLGADPGERQNLFTGDPAQPPLQLLEPIVIAWSGDVAQQTKLAVARAPTPKQEQRQRALGCVE